MGDATAASRGRRRPSPRLGCNLESKHTHSHPQLHPKRLACSQRHPQAWPSGARTWRSLWMREPTRCLMPSCYVRLLLLSPGCLGCCFELVLLSCRLLRNLMPRYRLCIRKETCHHANPSVVDRATGTQVEMPAWQGCCLAKWSRDLTRRRDDIAESIRRS